MAFGILEPTGSSEPVPGTVIIDEGAAHTHANIKHAAGTNDNIVLVPQPSDDPNDPLNWGTFQRNMVFFVILFGTIIQGAVPSPLLNAATVTLAIELNVSFDAITKVNGYLLLVTGAAGPIASALARKYGRRPVYILGSLFGIVGCIVGQCANDYNTLLAARVLQGFAVAPYEALCVATVGDLFFLHERGTKVGMVMFVLTAISNGVSIIAGVITERLGWKYTFHILLPFVLLQTVLNITLGWETAYNRSAARDLDTTGFTIQHTAEKDVVIQHSEEVGDLDQATTRRTMPTRKTFVQRMAIFSGTYTDSSLLAMVLAPLAILTNVIASFNVFISGLVIAWYVAVAVVAAILFSAPPYLFSAASVGFTSTGPLLGGLLGSLFYGGTSDIFARYLARRNNGVYEPEFALIISAVGVITAVGSLAGFGYAVQSGMSIYLIAFLWGLLLFGDNVIASSTTRYALDAFREYSVEIFIMNMVFKNFFFFGLTQYIVPWLLTRGPAQIFDTLAGITGGLGVLIVVMYVLGKKYRAAWKRHNIMQMLHLDGTKHGKDVVSM